MKQLIIVCLLFFNSACAFRESPQQSPENPQLISASVQIAWSPGKEGSGKLADLERQLTSLDGIHFNCERQITVPANVPETFTLYLPLPSDWDGELAGITANLRYGSGSGQSVPLEVGLSKYTGERASAGLDIRGLSRVLLPNEESSAEMTIQARKRDSGTNYSYRFVLRTPPSKLEVKQNTLLKFIADGGQLPKNVEKLISVNTKLDLIQVMSVRNLSGSSITAVIPIAPLGKLWTRFHQITINQGWCGYTTAVKDWDEELSSEFYMLPISSALTSNFLEYLNERILVGSFEMDLEPGESRLIGIYARGPGIDKLLSGGYVKQALQEKQVVKDCLAHCAVVGVSYWKKPDLYWKDQGYPGLSSSCLNVTCDGRFTSDSPKYIREKCNQCAEWELQNGLSPWDDRRFCMSPAPGNPWGYPAGEVWKVEKYLTSVLAGTETAPIYLDFQPDQIIGTVRFSDSPEEGLARPVRMLEPKSIQSE